MPKYDISDDGKTIDGKIVVFLKPPSVWADLPDSGGSTPAATGAGDSSDSSPAAAKSSEDSAPSDEPAAGGSGGASPAAKTSGASPDAGATDAKPSAAKTPAGSATSPAAEKAAAKKDGPEPALKDPRWTNSELQHGEDASMEISVEQGDGRRVRFIVERKDGEKWTKEGEVEAAVTGSKASAKIALEHPAQMSGNVLVEAGDHEIRFRCELI